MQTAIRSLEKQGQKMKDNTVFRLTRLKTSYQGEAQAIIVAAKNEKEARFLVSQLYSQPVSPHLRDQLTSLQDINPMTWRSRAHSYCARLSENVTKKGVLLIEVR